MEEARRLGARILAPDVNRSEAEFRAERIAGSQGDLPALRIGLGEIKGLTDGTLERILEARGAGGAFFSLPDFLERTGARTDEVEKLVQCGAFDAFDRTRPELLWRLHLLRAPARALPRARPGEAPLDVAQLEACRHAAPSAAPLPASTENWSGAPRIGLTGRSPAPGQELALFPEPATPALALPRLPDPDWRARALAEFEVLGLTVDAHPVEVFPVVTAREGEEVDRSRLLPCGRVPEHPGERVTVVGWLSASRRVRTADGRWMRFLTLEDESGLAEVVVFADVYARDGHRLTSCGPFRVRGTVEDHMGARTLHAERIG